MAQARPDHDPYEQARQDPGFLRAVEAAHRGRWAVLDALWWCARPDEASPGGTASPAVRLRALQRRVFAQDGDAAGDLDAARALRELELEISTERAAIATAVAAASVDSGPTTSAESTAAGSADSRAVGSAAPGTARAERDPSQQPEALPAEAQPAVTLPPDSPADTVLALGARVLASRRGRWALASGLIAAVLLGAIAGSQVTTATRSGASEPTPTPTATAAREAPGAEIFSRPQQPEDIPRVPLPTVFPPAELRYLGSAGFEDGDGDGLVDSPFYAARGNAGMFCLVAVPHGSGYLATCTHETEFPPAGLRLTWQSTDSFSTQADGAVIAFHDVTAVWFRGGTAEVQMDERPILGG